MAELQHPDIVGSYLATYNNARQQKVAEQDRARTYQRQDRQDEMAETQFAGQQDAQKIETALKRGQAMASIIGGVREGDAQGLETAKQRAAQELGLDPQQIAHLTINDLPRLRSESGLALKQLQEQAMRANIDQSRAATKASMAAAARSAATPIARPGIDPNTGARVAPAGVQGRDSGDLKDMRNVADAAARAATTLRSIAPSLGGIKTGPGASGARTTAGIFSSLGDVVSPLTSALGFGEAFTSAKDFINNFDAIEQASKDIGIAKLAEIGGSDTERELLTAIKTTVNPDVLPEENMRRFKNQLAAADILAKKAELATLWTNKAGSLGYALPDGTTWPAFWSQYQKAAWADARKQQAAPAAQGRGNYRDDQRQLLNTPRQGAVKPPPGFEIVNE